MLPSPTRGESARIECTDGRHANPIDVILTDTNIVQPDIVHVASDRLGQISERGIEGAPTLVIEILSPSTHTIDRHTKMQLYAHHGVRWYWLVDSDSRVVEVHGLAGRAYAMVSRIGGQEPLCAEPFPDLTIPPARLWA